MRDANTLYSLEDELFPEPPKPKGSGWWKWAIALILGTLFIYRSTRPVVRLSADPPPSFYDYNRTWTRQERQHERLVARAYWHVAVRRIQTYYSPNRALPADPPPQFQISEEARNLESDVIAGRVHYWYRLREVWNEQDAWVVSYGWNTDWVDSMLASLPRYIPKSVAGVFQSFVDLFSAIAQKISPP
jgi:hypothetical protein